MNNKIWEEFHGLTNTRALVKKKAEALSYVLLRSILKTTEVIEAKAEKTLSEDQRQKILEETTFVYVHVVDRFAFGYLDELRSVFMNDLLDYLKSQFVNNNVKSEFLTLQSVNERQREYSQYPELMPASGDIPAHTVLWEFSKKILGIIDRSEDPWIALTIMENTALSLSLFNLTELFSGK